VARPVALPLILLLLAATAVETTRAQSPAGPLFPPPTAEYGGQQVDTGNPAPPAGSIPNATGVVAGDPRVFNGQQAPAASVFPIPSTTVSPEAPPPQIFESAQILARIGTETILASDVVPLAEQALQEKLKEVPEAQRAAVTREQYDALKWQFTKVLLAQLVEVKIRYADAVANIPKENLPQVKASINESFDKTALKKLMEKYQATTRKELEEKMAAQGQSLDRQRQMFLERSLAGGWESQHVKENREIPVSEQLGYYQQNIADFEYPSKARWEELMVSFDRFNSKDEAYRAIAEMGNDVLRGADFAEVAKARSHGPTRFQGGVYDWTTKGSLVSKLLDEAIFGLPIGRMSQFLEDEQGVHIVRVIERVDAGRKEFLEAQAPIRQKLRDADIERQKKEFVAKMKARTPVWTIFDPPAGTPSSTTGAGGNDAALTGRSTVSPR
jgi:parvulin-like peptidyl-prolyl isomerase